VADNGSSPLSSTTQPVDIKEDGLCPTTAKNLLEKPGSFTVVMKAPGS